MPAGLARPASAQRATWPTQPIRFIGIFPPGGGTDTLSRIWCNRMSEITGHSFVVENRSGSGGNVGTEAIARATPDGNTIGLASVSSLAIAPTLYRRLPYDVNRDFSYVCGLWQLPNLLIVRNGLPARSVPELIALCRADPGRYSFGSSGAGTTLHIAGEMFKAMAGVDILHVPYKGSSQALTDVVAGQVTMLFDNAPSSIGFVQQGKLRAVAVTGTKRLPSLPDVPTIDEAGVKGYESLSWSGIAAPAGTPRPIIDKLNQAIDRVLKMDDVRQKFAAMGVEPVGGPPEAFTQHIRTETDKWGKLIKTSNISVN